jgi:dolichol-phosphate mannosyltransferase
MMAYKLDLDTDTWRLLRCPVCLGRKALEDTGGERGLEQFGDFWLIGTACEHKFRISEGIPLLLVEEGERWAATDRVRLPVPPPMALPGSEPLETDSPPAAKKHKSGKVTTYTKASDAVVPHAAIRSATVTEPTGDGHTCEVELSVLIPALNEERNLVDLLPKLRAVLNDLAVTYEILLITPESDGPSLDVAIDLGVTTVEQQERGYGGALVAGIARARGAYLLTMDADLSHPPDFIRDLWAKREEADVVIASRYVKGGSARMPRSRHVLSRVLNVFFSRGLSLQVRDMSSGFRLLKADIIRSYTLQARDFDIVQEVLVRAFADGCTVQEVPFDYAPRKHGSSHVRIFRFGLAYLKTFWSLWKFRNSILSADYDDRAYDSPIFLQRYWQRSRFRYVMELIKLQGSVLDVGCGSSRIIGALPPGSVAIDILLRKLRYDRKFGQSLVQASAFRLPFADASFPCVLCSEVIEHVPKDSPILNELCRVLEPGGRLVLGTPDYASWIWVLLEKLYGFVAPGGYADEHISHYTHEELVETMRSYGMVPEANRYILRGELILAFRKPA